MSCADFHFLLHYVITIHNPPTLQSDRCHGRSITQVVKRKPVISGAALPPKSLWACTHTQSIYGPLDFVQDYSGWAGTRKVKPIWILLKQETVSGSGISWAICKSAPHPRQITTPAPHRSVFPGRMPFLPPNQKIKALSMHCSVKSILSTLTLAKDGRQIPDHYIFDCLQCFDAVSITDGHGDKSGGPHKPSHGLALDWMWFNWLTHWQINQRQQCIM